MAFVRLIKQHGRNARQFWIAEHCRDKDRLGHYQHAGSVAALAVEPSQITDRVTRRLAEQLGHPLGGGSGRNPARRKQDHAAAAPRLIEQRCRNRSRLARARRGDQHGTAALAQGGQQVGENSVDRKLGHPRLLGAGALSWKVLVLEQVPALVRQPGLV